MGGKPGKGKDVPWGLAPIGGIVARIPKARRDGRISADNRRLGMHDVLGLPLEPRHSPHSGRIQCVDLLPLAACSADSSHDVSP